MLCVSYHSKCFGFTLCKFRRLTCFAIGSILCKFQILLVSFFSDTHEWFMLRNKSFHVIARFGAIYSAFKTKKYLSKNSTIGNRLLFSELPNIEFTCPENLNWWLHLPDSNLFLKFQNNFTAGFWATFSLIQTSAPTIFLKLLWSIYYINKSRFQKFQYKISANLFTRLNFLWTVGSF